MQYIIYYYDEKDDSITGVQCFTTREEAEKFLNDNPGYRT